MSGILNIALTGLNNATTRIANAASNIVNASSTHFSPQDVVSLSNNTGAQNLGVTTKTTSSSDVGDATDIATQIVNLNTAKINYSADALVIKTDKKLQDTLLDIKT